MTIEPFQSSGAQSSVVRFEIPETSKRADYERKLNCHRRRQVKLQSALAAERAKLCQKDAWIQQQDLLHKESEHRLLNGLQMISSLLSLQGRASKNAEAAAQLAAASKRVSMIARIQRRLHYPDGASTIAFKELLQDLCRDFSVMLSADSGVERAVVVEGGTSIFRQPSVFRWGSSQAN